MSELTLTKTRMTAGVWEGVITGAAAMPQLSVTHLGREIPGVTLYETKEAGMWLVQLPIPTEIISDGVQTLLVSNEDSGAVLGSVTLIAGDPLDGDIRAELDLLRAELDILKRAFRRHCAETS